MTIHFATIVYFALLQVARPSSALVVVDVQNDFISGSLAIINCPAGQNGEDVSSVDSRYLVHIYEDVRRYLVQGVFSQKHRVYFQKHLPVLGVYIDS